MQLWWLSDVQLKSQPGRIYISTFDFHSPDCFFFKYNQHAGAHQSEDATRVCVWESLHCVSVLHVGWAGVFSYLYFKWGVKSPRSSGSDTERLTPCKVVTLNHGEQRVNKRRDHGGIRPGAAANVLKSLEPHAWPPTLTAPSGSASSSEQQWADLTEESTALIPMQSVTFDSNFPFAKWCH